MSQPVDLDVRRLRDACSSDTTPEQLLRFVLEDIRTATVRIDRIVICGVTDEPEEHMRLHYWVGGTGIGGALELSAALKHAVLQEYFGESEGKE
jgi:hypothetical protein